MEYRISGMDCSSCAATLEKGVGKLEGVASVSVQFSTAKMQVTVQDRSTLERVEAQVRKLGYDAEPVAAGGTGKGQTYLIEGMDCGSCAATLEKHMRTLPQVHRVSVSFATGKMQIEHDLPPEEIVREVSKAGYRASLASRGKEVEQSRSQKGSSLTVFSGILLILGFVGSLTGVQETLVNLLYAVSIIAGGFKPAKSAFYAVKSGSLDMNVLMTAAALGAAAIGEWFEGATVVWLFALGNVLQTRSIERTRESIRSLMKLAPPEAWVKKGQELVRTPVERISVGDRIVVKPGEKIALDGVVVSGASSVNQAPITGESLPVDKEQGSPVYAGTVNESGSLEIKVTKLVEDTTIAKIIHLVEEAQEKKAPSEAFVDRFAKIYTPIVFVLALILMVFPPLFGVGSWGDWFYKGLELLVVACPCALVISTPVAIVSAIGNAARNGVLIKGGTFLEIAGSLQAVAFDKTGTLTEGKPKVSAIFTESGVSEEELLAVARTIEEHSKHPIAAAVLEYARQRGIDTRPGQSFRSIAGKGAKAEIGGMDYYVGNHKLFNELLVDVDSSMEATAATLQNEGSTLVFVGTAERILGLIAVADSIRKTSVHALAGLKRAGIEQIVMLTGDNEGTARKVAGLTGVDRYFADLLPEEKVKAVQQLQSEGKRVAMVGDGINDAPALASADLGIAMGGAGTDTAMETADIVLMADNLEKLPHTVRLSRKALAIIKQNIWFSIAIKAAALMLIFPGWLTLWAAVMSDTGAALIVILNSMRLLRMK
nr:heavy metal translocating P-type ATPase [Paenibacillus turpanensis]